MAHQQIHSSRRLLRGLPLTAIMATPLFALGMPTSWADPHEPIPPKTTNWGYSVGARRPGHAPNPAPDERRARKSNGAKHVDPEPTGLCGARPMGIGGCDPPPVPGPTAPAVTPADLAAQVWRNIRLPVPQVATAPPRTSSGLVGLPEWFWVTNWSAHTGRAHVGGVWASVTARPMSLRVTPGSGQRVLACAGPGIAYDTKRPAGAQRSNCVYSFERSSAGLPGAVYQVTAAVTWGGTWTGSGGAGGVLPTLTRSARFPLRIAEAQTVTGGR